MPRKTRDLYGYKLRGEDGELGTVEDLYFDDETWSVRYLVVETGHWLRKRRVLISPIAVGDVDHAEQRIDVKLTRDQIANSPPIESDIPVSRQKELQYRQYFLWPAYWIAAYYPTGETAGFLPGAAAIDESVDRREPLMLNEPVGDHHLRSARAVSGYHVMALDVPVGHVIDFAMDTADWRLSHVVLDRGGFLHHQRRAISVYWIERISWEMSTVEVGMAVGQIEMRSKSREKIAVAK